MVETLRNEIMQAQKVRSDLLKWKLILVAVLGATGLGIRDARIKSVPLVLCAIPFVCVYVDLMCAQLWLQMEVIGTYFRKISDKINKNDVNKNDLLKIINYIDYEEFVHKVRSKSKDDSTVTTKSFDPFILEHYVLFGSSAFLSLLIIIGAVLCLLNGPIICSDKIEGSLPYIISGILGLILGTLTWIGYYNRSKALSKL